MMRGRGYRTSQRVRRWSRRRLRELSKRRIHDRRWRDHRWSNHRWSTRRWSDHRWSDHRWSTHRWSNHRWSSHLDHQSNQSSLTRNLPQPGGTAPPGFPAGGARAQCLRSSRGVHRRLGQGLRSEMRFRGNRVRKTRSGKPRSGSHPSR